MRSDKYGYIMVPEAELLDAVLDDLKAVFGRITFLEIGVFGAGTVRGIYRRAAEIGCPAHCEGVDFEHYRPNPTPSSDYLFHSGDSMDMWRQIRGSFNLLFIDGCHCVNHAMCDFLNYSPLVEVGGFCLFHDTDVSTISVGNADPSTFQGGWPQDHSYAGKNESTLGVREALKKVGLLHGHRDDWKFVKEVKNRGDGTAGMMLFRKEMAL